MAIPLSYHVNLNTRAITNFYDPRKIRKNYFMIHYTDQKISPTYLMNLEDIDS